MCTKLGTPGRDRPGRNMQISPGLLLLVLHSGPELKAIGHPNAIYSERARQAQSTLLGLNARVPIAT